MRCKLKNLETSCFHGEFWSFTPVANPTGGHGRTQCSKVVFFSCRHISARGRMCVDLGNSAIELSRQIILPIYIYIQPALRDPGQSLSI
jgi:hypothetical protein